MIQLTSFDTILLKCQKWEIIEFLCLLHGLKKSENAIHKFFRDENDKICYLVTNLHKDVDSFFRSIPILLENQDFLHEYRTEINLNNRSFILSYTKLENEVDTPEKVFTRSIFMVDILLTQYKPFVEKLDDYDFKITPLRRHLFEVATRLTEILVKQIVNTDLSKSQEYIDLEMDNLDLIENLTQSSDPGIELAMNPDYIPGYVQPTRPLNTKDSKIRIDAVDFSKKLTMCTN